MKTVVIGWQDHALDHHWLDVVQAHLGDLGDIEYFDMTTMAEKGDAIDRIEQGGVDLAIAMNITDIYGGGATTEGWHYSKRNNQLISICRKMNTFLVIIGSHESRTVPTIVSAPVVLAMATDS